MPNHVSILSIAPLIAQDFISSLHPLLSHTDIKPENVLICVDESYIRKIAVEANEMVSMGMKLPTSLISTAPEEFQPQVPTGKLSKTKKKKLKKKAKLQNELIRMQMEHLQQAETEEIKGTKENDGAGDEHPVDEHLSVTATLSNNDESPTDNETSSHILNGSMKSNASSENEIDEKEKDKENEKTNNMSTSLKSNDESNEDNEDVDENVKMSTSSPSERVIEEASTKVVPIIQTTPPPNENGTSEHSKRSPKTTTTTTTAASMDPTFDVCEFEVKIADLGNACWVDKHFTEGEFKAKC